MERAIRAVGYVARRYMPRGRIRLARFLMRLSPRRELSYTDRWGYRRTARMADEMEALGFVGVRPLASEVADRIRPGDWVIDVGANVGLVTAQLCHLVRPAGLVWALEPLPHNVERLRSFTALNSLATLRIFEGALSDRTGTAALRLPAGGGSAYASLAKSWDTSGSIRVRTWRLDDLVHHGEPDRSIAFIKIDVEGFEPQVLAGAERTLREMKPLVLCEFNDILLRDAGSSSHALLGRFAELGYGPAGPVPAISGSVVDLLLVPRGA